MLPRLLCEKLCSLDVGVDKLAYSVFIEMKADGTVVEDSEEKWFGRTIIRSCGKLDYGLAQGIIDGKIETEKDVDEKYLAASKSLKHKFDDIILDVQNLWKIAKNRRAWRFDKKGSLTLDKVKLTFKLNDTRRPTQWHPYQCKESNWLIEEFMLLANQCVAKKFLEKIPQKAFLRRHPPPNMRSARRMLAICKAKNLVIDMSSAGALQKCLEKLPPKKRLLVETLLTKPMLCAEYICAGFCDTDDEYRHFALNFTHYTHYTSPIRRYADVMVHRMLSHAIDARKTSSKNRRIW
eukprot:UN30568